MRKRTALLCGIAAALLILILLKSHPASVAAGTNLIKNPGFEEGGSSPPNSWTLESKVRNKGEVQVESSVVNSGKYAVRLAPNGRNTDSNSPLAIGQALPKELLGGRRLKLSAWMSSQGPATGVVGVLALRKNGRIVPLLLSQPPEGSGRQEATVDLPPANDLKLVVIACSVAGTSGSVYFDDIAVEVLDTGSNSGLSSTDENVVKNPGFEQGGGAVPNGWIMEDKVRSKGQAILDSALTHSGNAALKLVPNSRNTDSNSPLAIGQSLPIPLLAGKTVRVSAYMGAQGGAVAVVALFAQHKDGKVEPVILTETGPNFTAHEGTLQIPPANEVQLIVLACSAGGTTGAAYFDDLSVRPDLDTERIPARGVESGELQAKISVRADKVIRVIPRTLFGTNSEWIFDGYGVWDSQRQALQPEIVKLARDLGTTLIRFPGGFFADYYHWRDGVGPQSARKTTQHYPGSPQSRHDFGTDEVLELTRLTNSELMLIANAGTGSAQEAADWVRYVNKRQQGSRVRFWEIGNELYINDGSPISKPITIRPEVYARRFLDFAKAMRAVDPDIKVGAIGAENYGLYRTSGYPDWNPQVLGIVGKHMDFLAVHNAYAPVTVAPQAKGRDVYEALLAAPVLIGRNLKTIADQIESATGKDSPISIAVTEWGPLFSVDPKSPWINHVGTLGSALFAADALKTFIESPRTDIANFFKLVDNNFMGWIGVRNGKYVPKAPYLAFQMYRSHFGDALLESNTESTTYNAPSVGLIEGVRDVPYLDSLASRSQDGQQLYILAINKSFDQSVRTGISITGLAPKRGMAWTLSGTAIDANVGTELPRGMEWGKQAEIDRFSHGGPNEVWIRSTAVPNVAEHFDYTFPPHSITALELQ
jgi:alpha-N-arabinofuranosidase